MTRSMKLDFAGLRNTSTSGNFELVRLLSISVITSSGSMQLCSFTASSTAFVDVLLVVGLLVGVDAVVPAQPGRGAHDAELQEFTAGLLQRNLLSCVHLASCHWPFPFFLLSTQFFSVPLSGWPGFQFT